VFGRRFEYIIATAFAQPDHDFSYAVEAGCCASKV